MKEFLFCLAILTGCNNNQEQSQSSKDTNSIKNHPDTVLIMDSLVEIYDQPPPPPPPPPPIPKIYFNKRFKDVTVTKTGEHSFLIKGKAQIFEANFSWVVEDGHNELQKGFQMTDAGAPEWGNFNFTIDVKKKRPNSTLHVILFEASAKDGSRQYELPLVLY